MHIQEPITERIMCLLSVTSRKKYIPTTQPSTDGAVARIGNVTASPSTELPYSQQIKAIPHVTPVIAPGKTARWYKCGEL